MSWIRLLSLLYASWFKQIFTHRIYFWCTLYFCALAGHVDLRLLKIRIRLKTNPLHFQSSRGQQQLGIGETQLRHPPQDPWTIESNPGWKSPCCCYLIFLLGNVFMGLKIEEKRREENRSKMVYDEISFPSLFPLCLASYLTSTSGTTVIFLLYALPEVFMHM